MKALKKGEALMLRTCGPKGRSYGKFIWPKSGPVKCKDWKPTQECGNGLHGLLWGAGDGSLLDWSENAAWLVVRIVASDAIELDGKIKVPSGVVEFFGKAEDAVALIQKYAPIGTPVVRGTATAGYRGTATAGDGGTATAGDLGTATSGERGTATAGIGGTATAGYRGTATAGYRGTATAGYLGTATAGDRGTATAGYLGTATAGDGGCIAILYWNGEKYRRAVFEVGENNIEPNQPYTVNEKGEAVKVEKVGQK